MSPSAATLRQVRRAVSRNRRLLAAGLAAGALACSLSALQPAAPTRVPVLTAAHDLPGGARLRAEDSTTVGLPPDAVPKGALGPDASLTGRHLAGPMRRGEPFTDARLAGAPLVTEEGLVATPVRVADPGVARLLGAGDTVDVIAAPTREGGSAEVVAAAVRVMSVPRSEADGLGAAGMGEGTLLVLATTSDQATALARAAVTSRLSVTLRAS